MSEDSGKRYIEAVRRQADRTRRGRRMDFWQGLNLAGAVGWMVVLPAIVGAFIGRRLDQHYQTGIFWTLSLLVIGLTLGCLSAWRHVSGQLK